MITGYPYKKKAMMHQIVVLKRFIRFEDDFIDPLFQVCNVRILFSLTAVVQVNVLLIAVIVM